MNPESAWQATLRQLQMEMPRASFDTWVRDTRFLSLDEEIFTVGVRNDYARDWLENRLRSTVDRMLLGMINQSVSVRFVVEDRVGDDFNDEGGESDDSFDNADEGDQSKDEVQIEAVWESSYEQIVRPEKAIALNAYFLRHLRELGPDLAWMYIGFRQAAYSAGGRTGLKAARFSGKSIATLSGSAERTFWNRAARPETWKRLTGLVNLIAEEPLWDKKKVARAGSKFPKRLPRKFSVSMTLPLTAADTRSLTRWISDHIQSCGGPAGVLAAACETSMTELIPISNQKPEDGTPLTVRRIVHDLFADSLPVTDLDAFAERLHLHLMPPGDLLMITLFFVEHVLPLLGDGQGWMLSILRDRCWVDLDSGEKRNQVTVKGGYAEIAGWLGFSRAKTIWEWLRDPALQIYLRDQRGLDKSEAGESNKWNTPRVFEVLLDEVPGEIVQMVLSGTDPEVHFSALSEGDFSLGVARFRVSGGAFGSIGMARFTEPGDSIGNGFPAPGGAFGSMMVARFTEPGDSVCHDLSAPGGAFGSIGVARLAVPGGAFGSTGVARLAVTSGAFGSIAVARLAQFGGAIGRVFKLLNSLNQLLNTKTNSPTSSKKSEGKKTIENSGGTGVSISWDLNSLMRFNQVRVKSQAALNTCGASGQAFASWLIYAYTPAAAKLDDPVGNAIVRLCESPSSGAGGVSDRLAKLPPQKLKAAIEQSLTGFPVQLSGFESALGRASKDRKQELLERLFGDKA